MVKFGKLDIFLILILFIILIGILFLIGLFLESVIYGWYDLIIFIIGFIILIISGKLSLKIIPKKVSKDFNIDAIIMIISTCFSVIIIIIPMALFLLIKSHYEKIELIKHGKKTLGVIYDFGRTKNSKYYIVNFTTPQNKIYRSNIHGNTENYKLGDTVRVFYSERIPEINRAY